MIPASEPFAATQAPARGGLRGLGHEFGEQGAGERRRLINDFIASTSPRT
ncbi:hypothetical protein ACH347_40985 [Saccharopolyspora sp. 5N102]